MHTPYTSMGDTSIVICMYFCVVGAFGIYLVFFLADQ